MLARFSFTFRPALIVFTLLMLSAQHAQTATQLVLTERLATDAFLDEAIGNHCLAADGTIGTQPLYRVLLLTKALLYRRIELLLQAQFPGNDFRFYATPVTHINDTEADRGAGCALSNPV